MSIDIGTTNPYNSFIMKKTILFLLCCYVVSFSSSGFAQTTDTARQVAAEQKVVTAVDVKGNSSISLSSILPKIKTRVGEPYLANVISDDLKRLYNTGFFADVRVDRQDDEGGFKVTFFVDEKPIVESITFSRLKYYKPRALLRKIKTQKGAFLDSRTLREDIKIIEELYEKKGLSLANVQVEQQKDAVTNKVRLHIIIDEGRRVRVRRIAFTGNKTFKSKRLMKVIKTRKSGFFTSGYLKENALEDDMKRIEAFYEKEGFIDVKATQSFEEDRSGRVKVKIQIEEGNRYYVDAVTLSGNTIFTQEQVLEVMKEIQPGKIFSRDRLSLDLAEVRSLYYDEGYIFANFKEFTSMNPTTGKVAVRLDIYEGDPAYVNAIKIQGNTRTRDIVIRREMRLYPGDKFDGSKLRRSRDRLRNLGYFNEISYDTEDTAVTDRKNLIVQVEEAKTGSFNFGGGYSTVDSLVGFVEIEQKNFDFTNWPTFTGGGQQLVFRSEASATRTNFRLSFTEPWIMDYPVSGGFDLYLTDLNSDNNIGYAYDEKRAGGKLRFGKQLSEYVNGGLYYRYEKVKISNFDDNVSAELLREEGENNLSVMGTGLTRDTRDSAFNPTKGLYLNGEVDLAGGPFAGDKDFYRLTSKASYNIPLKYNAVLEFRLNTGVMDSYGDSDYVPIFERFFAGGSKTIRGYRERKVGPLDSVTNDPIGGESMIVGNAELTIPLVDFLKWAFFYDTGNVWKEMEDIGSSGFKSGVGTGLRFKTPIGPINLDYGYPLDREDGEESRSGRFYFSVSRGF